VYIWQARKHESRRVTHSVLRTAKA